MSLRHASLARAARVRHASSPNYSVGFGWKTGDFVIWDNQATWHIAVNDYDGPRAYRKVIGG
ncbi:MAG: alkyl sulfatase [Mycobacterium sp.]|jgi:taurine dioxygenase|nr:alkyl sulfatase [Mycobacterium sp.]